MTEYGGDNVKNFYFLTVNGAGHMVPQVCPNDDDDDHDDDDVDVAVSLQFQPVAAWTMITKFIAGEAL